MSLVSAPQNFLRGFQPAITTQLIRAHVSQTVSRHQTGSRSFQDRTPLPLSIFRVTLCYFSNPQGHTCKYMSVATHPVWSHQGCWEGTPHPIGSIWDHHAPKAGGGICWTYGWKERDTHHTTPPPWAVQISREQRLHAAELMGGGDGFATDHWHDAHPQRGLGCSHLPPLRSEGLILWE